MNNASNHYQPGTCNIGPDEVAKRKMERVVSLIATVVLTAFYFYFKDSMILLFLLFVISCFAILMHFQVKNRFCVRFGAIGKFNFGKLGEGHQINDPGQVARDRKKVLSIGIQTLVLSLVYTGIIYLLTKSIHV